MLDSYWKGPSSRISPEAPVPVVKVNDKEDRAGGAANVAINIASLAFSFLPPVANLSTDKNRSPRSKLMLRGLLCFC